MEIIKEWVRNIFILILALTFIEILLPTGRMTQYIHFVFSLAIMASILTPILSLLE